MRLLLLASLLAALVTGCTASPGPPAGTRSTPSRSPVSAPTPSPTSPVRARPAVRVALTRWRTPAPVSRLTVTPGPRGTLLLAGGLTAGASTSHVFAFDPRTGRFRPLPDLAVATHDAAALTVRGHTVVLGGGSSSTTGLVQQVTTDRHGGLVVGHLPRPRSDAVAVRAGGTGYVVGGYDGSTADAVVLATRDGTTFHPVATLPVPVRYAAAAVTGHRLLVLGGLAVQGRHRGAPVATIQRVDLRTGQAGVVGHLPHPLEGAAAVTLGDVVYLAGGRSSSSSSAPASGAVFALDPRGDAVRRVGRLPLPVADAGVAALGHRAWLVGGESSGRTRSSVQTIALKDVGSR